MSISAFQRSILATDNFTLAGGIKVLITDTTVEITTLAVDQIYVVTAVGGAALLHQDATDASSANAGFDVCVPAGGMVRFRAISTTLNVIEADNTSVATAAIYIATVDEAKNPTPNL